MKKRAVGADSTSCLGFVDTQHKIETLPLYLHLKGERLRDVVDISAYNFIDWMNENPDELPTSSPPEPKDFYTLYESWIEQGIEEAIMVTLSASISETYQRAVNAAQQYTSKINIQVFDSRTTLYGEAMLALKAERLMKKNIPITAIMAELEYMRSHSDEMFVVGSLDYLIKNGRLSAAQGFLGRLLGIKPLLHFNEAGSIAPFGKVRGMDAALKQIITYLGPYLDTRNIEIYVMRSPDEQGMLFERRIKSLFPHLHIIGLPPSPVIACHTGPSLFGVGVYYP